MVADKEIIDQKAHTVGHITQFELELTETALKKIYGENNIKYKYEPWWKSFINLN